MLNKERPETRAFYARHLRPAYWRPKDPPQIPKYQKKTPRTRELFRKVRANFCLLPCDASQEPDRNCSEKLVQINFLILGRFFRADSPPLANEKKRTKKRTFQHARVHQFFWRVPNPPVANPLVAQRAPWRSSQSCVTGGQQPIENPYRFLSFLLHTWQPLCDPSWGMLFQLPGG